MVNGSFYKKKYYPILQRQCIRQVKGKITIPNSYGMNDEKCILLIRSIYPNEKHYLLFYFLMNYSIEMRYLYATNLKSHRHRIRIFFLRTVNND